MPERSLRIVKHDYPVTGICEYCNKTFLSRTENPDQAEREIQTQFEAHKCKLTDKTPCKVEQ